MFSHWTCQCLLFFVTTLVEVKNVTVNWLVKKHCFLGAKTQHVNKKNHSCLSTHKHWLVKEHCFFLGKNTACEKKTHCCLSTHKHRTGSAFFFFNSTASQSVNIQTVNKCFVKKSHCFLSKHSMWRKHFVIF